MCQSQQADQPACVPGPPPPCSISPGPSTPMTAEVLPTVPDYYVGVCCKCMLRMNSHFWFTAHAHAHALSQLLAYIYILSFLIFTLYSQLAPVRRSPQSAVAKSSSAVVSIDGGDLRRRVPTVSAAKSTTDDVLVHLNILEISKSI